MSKVGKVIKKLLENPNEWSISRYTAKHIPSNTELWIGNGAWYFDMYKQSCIGLIERHCLWIVFKKMRDEYFYLNITKSIK